MTKRRSDVGPSVCIAIALGLTWLPVAGAVVASMGLFPTDVVSRPSLSAYSELVGKPQFEEFLRLALRSVGVAVAGAVLGAVVVGSVAGRNSRAQAVVQFAVLAPLLIPDGVRGVAWADALSPDGVFGAMLPRGDPISGELALFSLLAMTVVPLVLATLVAALPPPWATSWLMVAELHKPGWLRFRRAVLQAVLPFAALAVAIGFVSGVYASAEAQFLGASGSSVQKIASSLTNTDPALLGAFGVIVLVLMCASVGVGLAGRRFASGGMARRDVSPGVVGRFGKRMRGVGDCAWPLVARLVMVAIGVGLWLPFLTLLALTLGARSTEGFPTAHFLKGALSSPELWAAFGNSLLVAGVAAAVVVGLGSQAARWGSGTAVGTAMIIGVCVPVLLPPDVQALSLQQALRWLGVQKSSIGAVVLCHVAWLLPFAVVASRVAYERVPKNLKQAAAEYGYSEREIYRRVVLPAAKPTVAASAIAVGVLSLTECRRGWHLAGPADLLSTRVFGVLNSGAVGDNGSVYAMAALASLTGVVGGVIALVLARQAVARRGAM